MDTNLKMLSSGWTAFILSFLIVVIIAAGWGAPIGLNWILIGIAMIVFIIVLGLSITGRPLGVLINERNVMSLSRLQVVIWTIVILSAYFTIAMERIHAGNITDPLAINIDWQLWALIGISVSSLVGTSLIQSIKKNKEPEATVTLRVATSLSKQVNEITENRVGLLYGNKDISEARFIDIFRGDEIENRSRPDLTKVQMFFFTIIAALSYIVLLYNMIITKYPSELTSFPVLSEGLILILGISHAGYLSNKAVDHTKTGS